MRPTSSNASPALPTSSPPAPRTPASAPTRCAGRSARPPPAVAPPTGPSRRWRWPIPGRSRCRWKPFSATAALDAAQALAREADALAARRLDAGELAGYRKLVGDYAASERLSDLSFARAPIGPLWRETAAREAAAPKSTGAGSEARADATDRLDVYGQRIPDELRWRAELAYLESGFQGADVSRTLKRFEEEFTKLSALAQTQPEIAMQRLAELQVELVRVSESFDRRWGQTLGVLQVERAALVKDLEAMRVAMDATIERERKALYAAISVERAALAGDTTRIGKELLAALGEVVSEALLLLCLLALILLGLPFLFGFLAGRAVTRRARPD
jgi:hypothetical protein